MSIIVAHMTLLHIWSTNILKWNPIFNSTNKLKTLATGFHMHFHDRISLEGIRDDVQSLLVKQNWVLFLMGPNDMDLADLAEYMMKTSNPVANSELECVDCDYSRSSTDTYGYYYDLQRSDLNVQSTYTLAKVFGRLLCLKTSHSCDQCGGVMNKNIHFLSTPDIMVFHLPFTTVHINQHMKLAEKSLELSGIVYYGENHYTSHVINTDRSIWFHDGITTGNIMTKDVSADNNSMFFNTCNGRQIALLVYSCNI
jgi:hypothetical protein